MKATPEPKKVANLMTLTIERDTFLIPDGKNIAEVLEILSGIRKVREDAFYYLEPSQRVLLDEGEAEIAVTCCRRELVTREKFEELKKANDAASEERHRKYAETTKPAIERAA